MSKLQQVKGGTFFETRCIVPVQETAKHLAKFGWPALSDVAVVTKPSRETPEPISAVSGPKFTVL